MRTCLVSATLAASLGCVAAVAVTAQADDGSVETVGGTVRLMKDQGNIRMVSEVVRARVSAEKIEVDCIFVMRNEGPADTVVVGFPDGSMHRYTQQSAMESFRSWVDGVEVKCRRVPDANSSLPEVDAPSWWTKRVVFPRGAVRTLRDHYTVSPFWSASLGSHGFQYELWTGASWKGTIGSAEIVATLDGIPLKWVTGTDPEARRVGRSFRWSFRNFEPGSPDGSPASVELDWREPGRVGDADEADTLAR